MELRQVPGRRLIPGDAQLAGRLAVQNRAALAAVIDSQRSGTRAQRRSRLPRRAGERRVFVCMRASKHESRESVLKNGPSQPNRTRKEEIHAWWVTPGCPCIALLRPSAKGAGRLLDAGRLQASGRAGRTGPLGTVRSKADQVGGCSEIPRANLGKAQRIAKALVGPDLSKAPVQLSAP